MEDAVLQPDECGRVYLTANNAHYFQKLLPHTLVGQVERVTEDSQSSTTPKILP